MQSGLDGKRLGAHREAARRSVWKWKIHVNQSLTIAIVRMELLTERCQASTARSDWGSELYRYMQKFVGRSVFTVI